VLLYRWILRMERGDEPTTEAGVPVLAEPQAAARGRVPAPMTNPQAATARDDYAPNALVSHS
jgi:hypothetical protein